MEQLNLVVPGLIADAAVFPFKDCYRQAEMADIEKLLARAERRWISCADEAALIWQCVTGEESMPSLAAISRLGEGGESDDYYWLRLDPVYLHPDRDSLLMFPNSHLTLSLEEARQLAGEVMAHFQDLSWHIEVPHPLRWYLRLDDDPGMTTTDLVDVIGKPIFQYLPTGERGKSWHSLLNEIQMLLHASPVNQARLARGEQVINALWPWGGGRLPQTQGTNWAIYGGGVFAQGLASLAKAAWYESAAEWQTLALPQSQGEKVFVILDDLVHPMREQNEVAWLKAFAALNRRWFAPLRQAVKQQQVGALNIYCGSGRVFTTTAKMQKRFWTPRQSLLNYAHKNNSKADCSDQIN